jgi:hypothetical protein
MSQPSHVTAFAGIHGSATSLSHVGPKEGSVLLDAAGLWAVRLHILSPEQARTLLQVMRDLSPQGTQLDAPLVRRISAYDEAAANNSRFAAEIADGVGKLDRLSRKIGKNVYLALNERPLRRTILTQMDNHPLFQRLGVHLLTSSAAV